MLWQARQPLQNAIFLPVSEMVSTSLPAECAPSAKDFAKASELLFFLSDVLIIKTFLDIIYPPYTSVFLMITLKVHFKSSPFLKINPIYF